MAPFTSLTLTAALAAASLFGGALAHPGEEHSAEKIRKGIEARDAAQANAGLVTRRCAGSATRAALQSRAAARRSVAAQLLREKRGIVHKDIVSKRDAESAQKYMKKCHDRSTEHPDWDPTTPEALIFTSNATVALNPESVVGPYFVAGEYIRSDLTESQVGVPVHLDLQFVDVHTCEPVPNLLVDVWHANATGVYSGVGGWGGGGLNTTWLRGVQVTDLDGVVEFDTLFPGHYSGRANHVHVLSRRGGQLLPNGTYAGGTVNHVGQVYFDQEITTQVESMHPYTLNYLPLTTNAGDFLLPMAATPDYDPFLDYVMLSDDSNDGLLMWATIGIDGAADHNAQAAPAATYRKGGGVAASFSFPPFPVPSNASRPAVPSGGSPKAVTTSVSSSSSAAARPPTPTALRVSATRSAPKKSPQPWGPCRTW